MNRFFGRAQIIALLVGAAGFIFREPPLVIIGLAVWLGIVAFESMRSRPAGKHASELSAESRALLRPLQHLRDEIADLVESHLDNPTVKVVGGDALK